MSHGGGNLLFDIKEKSHIAVVRRAAQTDISRTQRNSALRLYLGTNPSFLFNLEVKNSHPTKYNKNPCVFFYFAFVDWLVGNTLLTRFPLFDNRFLLGYLKSEVGVLLLCERWCPITICFSSSGLRTALHT